MPLGLLPGANFCHLQTESTRNRTADPATLRYPRGKFADDHQSLDSHWIASEKSAASQERFLGKYCPALLMNPQSVGSIAAKGCLAENCVRRRNFRASLAVVIAC